MALALRPLFSLEESGPSDVPSSGALFEVTQVRVDNGQREVVSDFATPLKHRVAQGATFLEAVRHHRHMSKLETRSVQGDNRGGSGVELDGAGEEFGDWLAEDHASLNL